MKKRKSADRPLHTTKPASADPAYTPPPAFPTKMHPNPSHLSKRAAIVSLLVIVAIFSAATLEIFLNKQSPIQNIIPATSQSIPTPTTTPTFIPDQPLQKGKTHYENKKYIFSFVIPENWYLREYVIDGGDNPNVLELYMDTQPVQDDKHFKIYMRIHLGDYTTSKRVLNFSDAGNISKAQITETTFLNKTIAKATVNSYVADAYSDKKFYEENRYVVIIPLQNTVLEISGDIQYQSSIESLLTSFTFAQN